MIFLDENISYSVHKNPGSPRKLATKYESCCWELTGICSFSAHKPPGHVHSLHFSVIPASVHTWEEGDSPGQPNTSSLGTVKQVLRQSIWIAARTAEGFIQQGTWQHSLRALGAPSPPSWISHDRGNTVGDAQDKANASIAHLKVCSLHRTVSASSSLFSIIPCPLLA